jgi:probable HAF family extracellular repeat protein
MNTLQRRLAMKSRILTYASAITLFASLLIRVSLATDDDRDHHHKHHHYELIDLGTFGGPSSFINSPENFIPALNRRGTTVGGSGTTVLTTSTSNPTAFCGGAQGLNPEVYHAFEWQDGVVSDLGSLAGANYCSTAGSINEHEEIQGVSERAVVDPAIGFNEIHAVVWQHRKITDLGTLGGNESWSWSINNRGQVVGIALNAVPDPFSMYDFVIFGSSSGTQTRAFLWDEKNGMQDLGTLGGPDAWAFAINDRGQVAGNSYTNSIPNPSTGFPTLDPFIWDKRTRRMQDLGNLGGVAGFIAAINNRGQVIGGSGIASDPAACSPGGSIEFNNPDCHPFLWDQGILTDLYTSTPGSHPTTAEAINDAGEIVGAAVFPNAPYDAYLWQNGVATDLGTLNGDCLSRPSAINSRDQVVGWSASCDGNDVRVFLWEDGSIVDLSTLIPQGSSLDPALAMAINECGEIAGVGVPLGVPPQDFNAQGHAFLAIPCDELHPGIEGCDYSLVEASATVNAATTMPGANMPATATSGISADAIRQLLQSVDSTLWRRRFGAHPQK